VQAKAPQIVTAVNELKQEGASVLATVPGPRQVLLGFGLGIVDDRQAGRGLAESGMTAAKGGLPGGPREVEASSEWFDREPGAPKQRDAAQDAISGQPRPDREGGVAAPTRMRAVPLEAGQTREPRASSEPAERRSEMPEAVTPALQQQVTPLVASHPTQELQVRADAAGDAEYDVDFWGARRGPPTDRPMQREESTFSFQAPQSLATSTRGAAMQQQIDNLGTVAGGRPLQVLLVLHDDSMAQTASEAVPTASELPAAETAPAEAAGVADPPSPE
jgi:hypothetical protein